MTMLPMHKHFWKTRKPWLIALSIIGFLLFWFMAGGIAVYYKLPPFSIIDNAMQAMNAQKLKEKIIKRALKKLDIVEDDTPRMIHKPGAFEGYTIYTTLPSPGLTTATLVDMDGKPLHRWVLPYSKFPAQVGTHRNVPDELMYWFDVYMYPNGDLLGVYNSKGGTPYGAGLVKMDKDSNVIWAYGEHVHHRVEVREDGTIVALIHNVVPPPDYKDITFGNAAILHDYLVILSPEGKELKRVSLIDALVNSNFRRVLKSRVGRNLGKGDVLHPNSVMTLTPEMAKHFPLFKPGNILVSMHHLRAIGMLDPDEGKFVWMTDGIWRGQHDAEFESDGTIMLLDNNGMRENQSRILKYNPTTEETKIVYAGSKEHPFYTKVIGEEQLLPNGDLMITETNRGRVFEINKDKEIVWQFIDPYHQHKSVLRITDSERYDPKKLTFLDDNPQ